MQEFLAHPCCQILLADLWHGGLRIRRNSNLKVLLGLLCPPFICALDFKTKDELLNQPQTAAEHAGKFCMRMIRRAEILLVRTEDVEEAERDTSDNESDSGSGGSLTYDDSDIEGGADKVRRQSSTSHRKFAHAGFGIIPVEHNEPDSTRVQQARTSAA